MLLKEFQLASQELICLPLKQNFTKSNKHQIHPEKLLLTYFDSNPFIDLSK